MRFLAFNFSTVFPTNQRTPNEILFCSKPRPTEQGWTWISFIMNLDGPNRDDRTNFTIIIVLSEFIARYWTVKANVTDCIFELDFKSKRALVETMTSRVKNDQSLQHISPKVPWKDQVDLVKFNNGCRQTDFFLGVFGVL